MKTPFRPLAIAIAFAFTLVAAAQTAPTGTIEGRVFNAATGSALRAARVVVEGTQLVTETDDFGAYRFAGVAAGDTRITVAYVGLETATAAVRVTAGGAAQRDFDLALPDSSAARPSAAADAVVKLVAYNVVADREMSAQAIAQNERKSAANIRQVVAFDEFGDRNAEGTQFGFTAAGGKLRGHADGVIVAGPDIGIRWPALWESKALGQKSWTDLVKHGLRQSKPIYFAQVQLYMAYFELEVALLTAVNRDSLALHHEAVPFDAAEAQRLSDRAVDVLRAAEARELPPRIAAQADFYLCRVCPYAARCWERHA